MAEENKKMPEAPQGADNPLDQQEEKKDESNLLGNIVTAETSQQESLLGKAPEIDPNLMKGAIPPKSGVLTLLKTLSIVMVVAIIGGFLFFKSQLNGSFAFLTNTLNLPSIADELSSTNAEILQLQTQSNYYRYLQIKGHLDRFTYYGDNFIQNYNVVNSQTSSQSDRRDAERRLTELTKLLGEDFQAIQENYSESFTAPLALESENVKKVFEDELLVQLNKEAQLVEGSDDKDAQREHQKLLHTIRLVTNDGLKNAFLKTDFENLSQQEVYSFVKEVSGLAVNNLTLIQSIKNERVKWSDIINEIELRTIAVDSFYTDNFYDELGGIIYTSYDFDQERNRIVLVGETKRFDTTNFTMIANLIDEFNSSDFFDEAEMRSFSKSGSLNEGYTATLKLSLKLIGENNE